MWMYFKLNNLAEGGPGNISIQVLIFWPASIIIIAGVKKDITEKHDSGVMRVNGLRQAKPASSKVSSEPTLPGWLPQSIYTFLRRPFKMRQVIWPQLTMLIRGSLVSLKRCLTSCITSRSYLHCWEEGAMLMLG